MNKPKFWSFEYNCVIKVIKVDGERDLQVLGWNSPAAYNKNEQSLEDIKYIILGKKIVDIMALDIDKIYQLHFIVKFLENPDHSHTLFANLKKLEEK